MPAQHAISIVSFANMKQSVVSHYLNYNLGRQCLAFGDSASIAQCVVTVVTMVLLVGRPRSRHQINAISSRIHEVSVTIWDSSVVRSGI